MSNTLKSVAKYLGIILMVAALLWVSLSGLQTGDQKKSAFLWEAWKAADKFYLALMALTLTISHVFRAERWKMLLEPGNHTISITSGFLGITIGYLVNLVVPRGGEVSRCYYLYKLEKTPVEISFGTVVIERIVDVVSLLSIVVLSFLVEWGKLSGFIKTLSFSSDGLLLLLPWAVVGALLLALLWWLFRRVRKNEKVIKIWQGFKEGMMSIFRLKARGKFIVISVIIWLLYYVASYFVIKAFPETDHLGFGAVLTLFALGSIAMAVPLPGGTGSYHTIVPLGLVALYQLPKPEAIAFVFIFHAWQTLVIIITGIFSLILTYVIIAWKKRKAR